MERKSLCLIGLWLIAASAAHGADEISLVATDRVGDSTRVSVDLKADGSFLPGSPTATKEGEPKPAPVKPLALKVEMRLEFDEKVLLVGPTSQATRSVRRVSRAASAINGDIRPSSATIRPEVSLLVADLRPEAGLVVYSPSGPLMRAELELLQGPADPLLLAGLLPGRSVKVGDEWNLGNDAAKSLSGYDALATNTLVAKLESADDAAAKVSIRGTVRGAVLGGEGNISCDGQFTFDRKAGRVSGLTVKRKEKRQPGQVEDGLDVASTLTVARTASEVPPELGTEVLAAVPLDPKPDRELLLFRSADGKYSLVHDRDWHIHWDSDRVSVLKRLDRGGDLLAQCNLSMGPNLGKGRHQDPRRFRDDIRRALGERFVALLGEGEVEGAPEGGYKYKVGVQGRAGESGVLWYYYLLASPDGDQLTATFTLGQNQEKAFGNQDLQLVGSLEWTGAKP